MDHKYKNCNCGRNGCVVCEGHDSCIICGGVDGELPMDCPGCEMTSDIKKAVLDCRSDYYGGQWQHMSTDWR